MVGHGAHLVVCLKFEHLMQTMGLDCAENLLEQWKQKSGGFGAVEGK